MEMVYRRSKCISFKKVLLKEIFNTYSTYTKILFKNILMIFNELSFILACVMFVRFFRLKSVVALYFCETFFFWPGGSIENNFNLLRDKKRTVM